MIKPQVVDFPVNTSLLNPGFNGYKLSLDNLPMYEKSFRFEVAQFRTSEEQFSLHHTKIVAQSSALFFDSFHSTDDVSYFYICGSDNCLYRVFFTNSNRTWSSIVKVFSFERDSSKSTYPVSLFFCSKTQVVFSNGSGLLQFIATENERLDWKVQFSYKFSNVPYFYTVDCRHEDEQVHVLIHFVVHKDNITEKTSANFVNRFVSTTFDMKGFHVIKQHEFWTAGIVDASTYSADCSTIIFLSSERPMCKGQSISGSKKNQINRDFGDEASKPLYIWTEKDDEISVIFQLEEKVSKADIKFNVTDSFIQLTIGETVLLEGPLGGSIRPSDAIWTLDSGNFLEISLTKQASTTLWSCLVAGDTRGKFQLDAELLSAAKDMLQKFTSETEALSDSGANVNFNNDQLEECDMTDEHLLCVYWYGINDECVVKQCDVSGSQFMFATQPFSNEATRICLRHDVDGLLLSGDGTKFDHIATFNALGYVQASKSFRRWTDCSPDHSYAVIAEGKNHVFFYWQSDRVDSDLRNRKTLQQVSSVSKQQVISLRNRNDPSSLDTNDFDYSIHAIKPLNNIFILLSVDRMYSVLLI